MRKQEVVWVREYYPRQGTKAQLEWLDTGESTAVWIDHRLLNTRDIVAASGNRGWGPHHDEEVFFIGRCAGPVHKQAHLQGMAPAPCKACAGSNQAANLIGGMAALPVAGLQ